MSDEVKKVPEDKKEEKRDADAQGYNCVFHCEIDDGRPTNGTQFWVFRS